MTTDGRPPTAGHRPRRGGGLRSVVRHTWPRHVALALLAALAAGALAFLAARGVGAAVLFVQQQELLRQVAGTLGGGIEGLAGGDLRGVRRELERLDAAYWRLSLVVGALAAAGAAAITYLRLERPPRGGAADAP